MNDPIDRQAAITIPIPPKWNRKYLTTNLDDAYELGWDDCQKCIGALPSAQPERQRGAWIEYIPEHGKCPFCGNQVDLLNGKANNFCGECGADMRGEQE